VESHHEEDLRLEDFRGESAHPDRYAAIYSD